MNLEDKIEKYKKRMEEAATVAELEAVYNECREFIFDNEKQLDFEKKIYDAAYVCSIKRSKFPERPYVDPLTGDLVTRAGCFPI